MKYRVGALVTGMVYDEFEADSEERFISMKQMPYKIKQKLRQYANIQYKAKLLQREVEYMIEEYEVPIENLIADADIYTDGP